VARALAAAIVVSLLAVSGASGASPQKPKRGGTVVYSRPAQSEPTCLNPIVCDVLGDPALTQVLEGAYETGPDLVERPNLVSGVDIGRDPFTLTYHIRPKARWSDDAPVTAFDFQFTQRTFAKVADPDLRKLYRRVRRTRALDAKTFRVELREPFADWRDLYEEVLPRHALAGEDLTQVWMDGIDDPKTGRPIGSGPFLVGPWERGKQLTLVRNPRYWGPHTAYLDRFIVRFNADSDPSDPLGPFRRNEFDVTLLLTPELALAVRQLPGWRVAAWPGTFAEHFLFRVVPGGNPALQSKLVRQALAYGIDRKEIAHTILAEANERARRPLDSTVFLPNEPYYQANWSGYRYDPARARRLLEQAGCRRGSPGIYSCAGELLRLRFVTTAGDPVRQRVLQLAQAQLRRIGVEVVPAYVPRDPFFEQVLPSGEFDAALFAWGVGDGVVWPEAQCGAASNWTGYCSRLVRRDVQQTDLIVDPQQRARVLNAADAKLARAVPVLPVVQFPVRAAIRTMVRGVVPGGSQYEFSQNSEDWWVER
jgi:peptide/nickel transport system substrate-binding protein